MKAPFIFMNEESEYFYIFPNVFCLNRLPLNYLTPEKLFKFIDYTIS